MIQVPEIFEDNFVLNNSVAGLKLYKNARNAERAKVTLSRFMFSFVLSGEKHINYTNDFAKVSSNEFLLLKPSNCIMTERISHEEGYSALLQHFQPEAFLNLNFIKENKTSIPKASKDFLVLPLDPYIKSYIHSAIVLLNTPQMLKEDLCVLKTQELLSYLHHKHGNVITAFLLSGFQPTPVSKIKEITERNLDRKLTIDELSFLCNMSVSTYKRKFKEVYGTTPAKWFQKQRLLMAKHQISKFNKSPGEVYQDTGFQSFSSFSQAFKKEFGILPSQVGNRAIG